MTTVHGLPEPASDRFVVGLGLVFAALFLALGWAPYDRGDWLLENLISGPVALGLVLARRRLRLSALSWCLVFGFLALHEIGSHYTYSRVPGGEWLAFPTGGPSEVPRNAYDRAVHLAFGLLCTHPVAELLGRRARLNPWLLRVLPICVVMTASSLYELLEWAAAEIVDPELGVAFVGAQGDVWDAQKDMTLALGGSIVATVVVALAERIVRRRPARAATSRSGSGAEAGAGGEPTS